MISPVSAQTKFPAQTARAAGLRITAKGDVGLQSIVSYLEHRYLYRALRFGAGRARHQAQEFSQVNAIGLSVREYRTYTTGEESCPEHSYTSGSR